MRKMHVWMSDVKSLNQSGDSRHSLSPPLRLPSVREQGAALKLQSRLSPLTSSCNRRAYSASESISTMMPTATAGRDGTRGGGGERIGINQRAERECGGWVTVARTGSSASEEICDVLQYRSGESVCRCE